MPRTVSIIAVQLLAALAVAQPLANLLPNPSFELVEPPPPQRDRLMRGLPDPADEWLPRTFQLWGDGDARWRCPDDPQQARSGRRSVLLAAGRGAAGLRYGPLPVPTPGPWTVQLWARGEGQIVVGGHHTYPDRWEPLGQESALAVSPDWQCLQARVEPDATCGWWLLQVSTRGQAQVWLDDMSVSGPGLPAVALPPPQALTADTHTLLHMPCEELPDPSRFFIQGEVRVAAGGRFGNCLELGPGAYLACPTAGHLATAAGTIELWVNLLSPGCDGVGLNLVGVTGWDGLGLCKDQYSHLSFDFHANWAPLCRAWADGYAYTWRPGVWRHLAACWDQDLMQVFADGKLIACAYEPRTPDMLGPELHLGDAGMRLDDLRLSDVVRYRLPVPPLRVKGQRGGQLPRSN